MPKDNLPIHVSATRFAENATQLHGSLSVSAMPRLCSSLFSEAGEVEVAFQFGVDEQKTRFVEAQYATVLVLQCQRCLEAFEYRIAGDVNYGMVDNEARLKKLSDRYEPFLVVDDTVVLQDLIEEELIISLPLVPKHDLEQCKASLPIVAAFKDKEQQVVKENPFKVIETLKTKPKQE